MTGVVFARRAKAISIASHLLHSPRSGGAILVGWAPAEPSTDPLITTSDCQNFCSRLSKLTVPVSLLGEVESDLSFGCFPSVTRSMVFS